MSVGIMDDGHPGQARLERLAAAYETLKDIAKLVELDSQEQDGEKLYQTVKMKLDRLVNLERVRAYARHKSDCASLEPIAIRPLCPCTGCNYKPCSCGLDEALHACEEEQKT